MIYNSAILTIIAYGMCIVLMFGGSFAAFIGGIMLLEKHNHDEALPYVLIAIACWAIAIGIDMLMI